MIARSSATTVTHARNLSNRAQEPAALIEVRQLTKKTIQTTFDYVEDAKEWAALAIDLLNSKEPSSDSRKAIVLDALNHCEADARRCSQMAQAVRMLLTQPRP